MVPDVEAEVGEKAEKAEEEEANGTGGGVGEDDGSLFASAFSVALTSLGPSPKSALAPSTFTIRGGSVSSATRMRPAAATGWPRMICSVAKSIPSMALSSMGSTGLRAKLNVKRG